MKIFVVLVPLSFSLGCHNTVLDVNKCIDTRLNKYDALQKDLDNPKKFNDTYCKEGICKTRDEVQSDCFIKPYNKAQKQ